MKKLSVLLLPLLLSGALAQVDVCDAAKSGDIPLMTNTGDWLLRSNPNGWTADMVVGTPLNLREKTLLSLFASSLKAQGTTVLVAALPPRGVVAIGSKGVPTAPANYPLDSAIGAYTNYLADLQKSGFTVVNPLDRPMPSLSDFYFKRDHHWTPTGSKLVADLLKDQYAKLGVALTPTRFKLKDSTSRQKYGTLATILEQKCKIKPADEPYTAFTVEDTQSSNSLLGGDNVDAVVGTSNTDGLDLDFISNLKMSTGLDFVNGAVTGGANFGSWENWLTTSNQTPARSIVWEQEYITMRYPEKNPDSILSKIPQLVPRIGDTCGAPAESVNLTPNTFTPLNVGLAPRQYLKLEVADPQVKTIDLDRIAGVANDTVSLIKSDRINNDGVFYSLNESEYTRYQNLQIKAASAVSVKYKVCDSKIPEQYGVSAVSPSALPLDLVQSTAGSVFLRNVGDIENGKYRWASEHHAVAEFVLEPGKQATVQLAFFNPIAAQNVEVFINGQRVDSIQAIQQGASTQRSYTFTSKQKNEVMITYERNNKTDPFAPKDSRSLGILFQQWIIK